MSSVRGCVRDDSLLVEMAGASQRTSLAQSSSVYVPFGISVCDRRRVAANERGWPRTIGCGEEPDTTAGLVCDLGGERAMVIVSTAPARFLEPCSEVTGVVRRVDVVARDADV